MLASRLRGPINKVARPLGKAVGKTGISANTLTVAGVVFVALGVWFYLLGHPMTGAFVMGIGGVLDLIDGAVAKATHTETVFGAFLDSTTDRISDGILFSGIVYYLALHGPGRVSLGLSTSTVVAIGLAVLVLGFLTPYLKGKAETLGFTCDVGIAERGERVLIGAVGIGLQLTVSALVILFVLSLITVAQRYVVVWRQASAARRA
ncbi:MAG TPA: CDP-alcohol phosphatidyltransferase family protein [Actinomycetota bacterium]|nr:CDP-alcohol phosphatidyltransferase family protein [Actinomycetota bacterium]